MFRQKFLIFCIFGSLIPIGPILCGILCKDSQIDAIAYADDLQMYFIAIGGYYWYVKANKFPITEKTAKKLPSPFTKVSAAVYINGDAGCVQSRSGMRAREKEIWITDIIDGQIKLLSYDTKIGKWSSSPIAYDQDKCIAKAQIDFTSGKPIDAIFTRNHLQVYLVQGSKYAMVDCMFLCSNPDGSEFGTDSSPYPTSDFGTQDPINAMITIGDKKLLMFHEKQYYVMTIDERYSQNGKVKANKVGTGKDVIADFLKLQELPEQCDDTEPEPQPDTPDSGNSTEPENNDEETGLEPEIGDIEDPPSDDSNGLLWIIVAIVAIAIIAIIGLLAFFAMRKKPAADQGAGMEAGPGSKVASQKSGSKVGSATGSKAGAGSKVANSPTNSSLGTKSQRSRIGQSKAPASGMKSSASKK